ncbi:MAG TPA: helix-turn-helix domain-containing protein [Nocardioidaceae bacterium]|nr:helix-turn-helix domain-containing protein [Nocardioidaceae bacterium]
MPPELTEAEQDNLLRAVERITLMLTDAGMPRMAARVFSYVLADDDDRYTASELAEGLRVSPAAISGAVRYLLDARMLFKEREPGTRADLYRIYDDDVWGAIMLARIPLLEMWETALDDAIGEIGTHHRGGQRLAETKEFVAFTKVETAAMVQRWKEHRHSLD